MEGVSSNSSNFWSKSNSNLKILYFNARSLLPRFDKLLLLTDFHRPDVICITESWPCLDMDSEISIPGYQTMRLDWCGVFSSTCWISILLNGFLPMHLLSCLLNIGNYKSCLSLFYRPPSSPADILYSLHRYFESINIPQFSSLYSLVTLISTF